MPILKSEPMPVWLNCKRMIQFIWKDGKPYVMYLEKVFSKYWTSENRIEIEYFVFELIRISENLRQTGN